MRKVQLWRRLAAAFYDALLLIALYFIVGWIAVMSNDGEAVESFWMFWLLLLIAWGFSSNFGGILVKLWECRFGNFVLYKRAARQLLHVKRQHVMFLR